MPRAEPLHVSQSPTMSRGSVHCSPMVDREVRAGGLRQWLPVFDALPVRIVLCDRNGRIRLLNASSRQHLESLSPGSARIGGDYLAVMRGCISSDCIRESFEAGLHLLFGGRAAFRHPVQVRGDAGESSFTVVGSPIPGEEGLFLICHQNVQGEESCFAQSLLRECMFLAEDAERRRIARELHDETAQQLALLRVNLARFMHANAAAGNSPDLAEAESAVDQIQSQIRTLTYMLHPPGLAEDGIAVALQRFCREIARRTGLEVQFANHAGEISRSPAMERAFYRIAQEGMNNVLKHARARRVLVTLKRDGHSMVLEVEDDGVGVPEHVVRDLQSAGVGLPGIRERLDAFAGDLRIGRASRGTRLTATIPWQRAGVVEVMPR